MNESCDPVKDNLLGKFFLLVFGLASVGGLFYGVSHSNLSALWANVQLATTVSSPASSLDDGLVGHWTFDGPDMDWASTTAEVRDVSGNGNHGDATMGMTSSAATGGQIGSALVFPGAILIGSPVELTNIGSFTYSAWFDVDGVPQNSHGFILSKTSGSGEDIVLEYSTNVFNNYTLRGIVNFDSTDASATSQNLYSAIGIGDGTDAGWHHVIMVYDDITKRIGLYLDGTEVSYQTRVGGVSARVDDSNTDLYIGNNNYGQRDFVGKLDDVRVYNRVLSADEVMQLYKKGEGTKIATTPTLPANDSLNQGLVGHWTFDGPDVDWSSTTAEVQDVSGNGNHGNSQAEASTYAIEAIPGKVGQGGKWPIVPYSGHGAGVNIGSSASLDDIETQNSGGMSGSIWILPSGTTGSLISSMVDCQISTNQGRWSFRLLNRGLSFCMNHSTNNLLTNSISNIISLEEWTHVAFTWDGTSSSTGVHLFVNGVEVSSYSVQTDGVGARSSDSSNSKFIGNGIWSGQDDYFGSIDEVRIYNRVLSTDEITRLYQMGEGTKIATTIKTSGSPLEQGLVGHWTFDGPDVEWSSTTAEVRDVSGYGNHGDAVSLTNRSVTAGRQGQGMSFNGSSHISMGDPADGSLDPTGSFTLSAWAKTTQSVGAGQYGANCRKRLS